MLGSQWPAQSGLGLGLGLGLVLVLGLGLLVPFIMLQCVDCRAPLLIIDQSHLTAPSIKCQPIDWIFIWAAHTHTHSHTQTRVAPRVRVSAVQSVSHPHPRDRWSMILSACPVAGRASPAANFKRRRRHRRCLIDEPTLDRVYVCVSVCMSVCWRAFAQSKRKLERITPRYKPFIVHRSSIVKYHLSYIDHTSLYTIYHISWIDHPSLYAIYRISITSRYISNMDDQSLSYNINDIMYHISFTHYIQCIYYRSPIVKYHLSYIDHTSLNTI